MKNGSTERQPIFWMNVTTSEKWNRAAVGVVRVEQEIRRHLAKLLGERLRPIMLRDGKFEVVANHKPTPAGRTEFWPDPSFVVSSDIFDPLQSPVLAAGKVSAKESPSNPQFRPGDVLISIGLDWDYGDLQPEIRRISRIYDLTVITCCYDLIPALFPQYCVGDVAAWFKSYLIDLTWNSDGVLCISENTRKDYLKLCSSIGLPIRSAEVVHLGSSLPSSPAKEEPSDAVKIVLAGKFFLFVSTIERRKNHEVLYRAYRLIRSEHPDLELPKLVFVGMQGWGVADLMNDIALDPLTKNDILILPHVTDSELTLLYSKCEAFLYPSLYEGWGLPVAEALQLGRPVFAAGTGSIPEVGGDLVRYLDPWSPREWAIELHAVAAQKVDLKSWSKQIAEKFKPFEWAAAAETVITLAQKLQRAKPKTRVFDAGYDLSTLHGIYFGDKIIYSGRHGIVCHGPYVALGEGSYEVIIEMDWLDSVPGKLQFTAAHDHGQSQIAREVVDGRSLAPGRHEIVLSFDLSEQVDDFEVVCEVNCPGDVRIAIERLKLNCGINLKISKKGQSDSDKIQPAAKSSQRQGLRQY